MSPHAVTYANSPALGDRLPLGTRVLAAIIVPVLLLAFILLYFWPDNTDQLFAWTIKPRMTPLWMGGGYLSGSYFFVRVFFARRWHTVAPAFMGVIAFVTCMALATFLHVDRFHQGHLMFYLWAGVYAVSPFLTSLVAFLNWNLYSAGPEADDAVVPLILRWGMGAIFTLYLVLGAMMFLWPDIGISLWPWTLTSLTARVVAGWLALPGVAGPVMVRDSRWSAWRVTIETASIWWALNLLGFFRASDDFDPASPGTWMFVSAMALSLIGYAALYIVMEMKVRRGG